MNSLKAALAEKRTAHQADLGQIGAEKKKFVRRGDVRQAQEQDEERKRAQAEAERAAQVAKREEEREAARTRFVAKKRRTEAVALMEASTASASATATSTPEPTEATTSDAGANYQVSDEEAMLRLRSRGEPIRLFGESTKDRRLRLRALELMEQRGDKVGQNDFMAAMGRAEQTETEATLGKRPDSKPADSNHEAEKSSKGKAKHREGANMDSVLDLNLFQTDESKVYPLIYYFLKGLLQDWAEALAARPDEVRSSVAGKMAAATQVQSESYLKPLFKQLRHRTLPSDMLLRIAEIVHYIQKREYRHANDSYLQLSIGNAPWPIGATSVGIHERSGREKIFSSKIAHVLNDEETRKYIQSLKRMMTFAQTKYPPQDVSMLMG